MGNEDKDYKSPIAETVEAGGNVLNNMKTNSFLYLIVIMVLLGAGYFLSKSLELLIDIKTQLVEIKRTSAQTKDEVKRNNDLVIKETETIKNKEE